MKRFNLFVVASMVAILLIPTLAFANVTSYTSGFQLQNLSNNDAAVTITFYNQDGTEANSVGDSIPANSSKTYFPLSQVTEGFNGSLVVSSDQPVAALANVLGNGTSYGASYVGFSSGATSVNLPLVMKANYGISTWFNVQNTGAGNADVNVTFAGSTCTASATIAPNAAHTFDQALDACLASGYVGAATITSNEPVVAVVIQVTSDDAGLKPNLLAYNGFTSASTNPVMPLISSGYWGSGTGIQIQNTGSSSTDITVSYTPSAGFPGAACTETKTIAAGNSVTFGFPSLPSTCYTDAGNAGAAAFVGSAKVTNNTANQNLVAIVNQITVGKSHAAAYGAFNAANATNTVSLPLVMDRNYGIFTGFSVANVGAANTNITCTFSSSTYTVSASNVAPGVSLTDVQLDKIAPNYVGSATCTSSGQPIVAVVNQLNTGTVIAVEDGLLVSEGINY